MRDIGNISKMKNRSIPNNSNKTKQNRKIDRQREKKEQFITNRHRIEASLKAANSEKQQKRE
jgi:hypothetical protein